MRKKAVDFRTAKRYRGGRMREKPQAFPVTSVIRKKKPTLLYKAAGIRRVSKQTALSKETLLAEKRLLAAGFKGWSIGITYKDGTSEVIPIIARSHEEALAKARPKMNQIASQVYEIVIIDPSLGEVLHKIGAGAARVARAIGKGVYKGVRVVAGAARRIASEVAQAREERAAREEGKALTGESPLTVTREEKVAREVVAAEEAPRVLAPGERAVITMPRRLRRRKTRVIVEVGD